MIETDFESLLEFRELIAYNTYMTKCCTKCKKDKPFNQFSFKRKALGLRHYQCKKCTRELIRNHYNNNRTYYLEKTRKRNGKNRLEILNLVQDYLLKHPCIDCGEKDPTVLEFDHKHKKDKFREISKLIRGRYPIRVVKEEIGKCDIRCANCHRRKTAKQFKWFKGKDALVA